MSRLNHAHRVLLLIFKLSPSDLQSYQKVTQADRKSEQTRQTYQTKKVELSSHLHHTDKTTMPSYNTPAYYPTSPPSHGLPSDEYKYLKRQQEKSHLEWHLAKKHILPPPSSSSFPSSSSSSYTSTPSFSSSSSLSSSSYPPPPFPPTPYQTQRLPHAHRVQISEVKNATREALASVFDSSSDDDVYETWPRSRRDDSAYRRMSSRRDVDEYYARNRGRENRGSGGSMRVGYHNMGRYGGSSRFSADEDVGGLRLGSKFSFDSLDGA